MPRLLAAVVVTAAACWAGGLVWFMNWTSQLPASPPPHADGIVALTGGAGRVDLALRLLANGHADRLLLSGIGGGTDLATLGRLAGIDTTRLADRVTLGRYAASTRGNGVETAAWAEQNRIGSLIVVTAAYHMPRALAELRQALPDVRLFPLPVSSASGRSGGAADRGPGLRLEAEEYTKYLLTASGLSAWFPHREPASAAGMPAGAGG
ncbi:MAG TPA: YdcF family protein [Rhodopila sp.]